MKKSKREVTVLTDVPYRKIGARHICLDAVLVRTQRPSPVLVSIHGGGWKTGTKNGSTPLLAECIAAGISWVTIDYRLSTEAVHPAQVEDCTYALQFVKSKAKAWHIDPDRIALEGHSAGGHLALWVGLHPDMADRTSKDPVQRMSTRVRAIVDRAGPADFSLLNKIKHEAHEYVYLFMGHARDGKEHLGSPGDTLTHAQMDNVSPLSYVSGDSAPVFIVHGTADKTVPVQHSRNMEKAFKKHKVPYKVHYIENGDHGAWYEGLNQDMFRFIKDHLSRTDSAQHR